MLFNYKKIVAAILFGLVFANSVSAACACQRPQAQKPAGQK